MKKLMIYLSEDVHEDLRQLAFRKRTSMAALVRYALDKTFEDELDVIAGERALEEAAKNPDSIPHGYSGQWAQFMTLRFRPQPLISQTWQ